MTEPDLSVCAICGDTALFTDSDPGANWVSYCARDLPAHLRDRAANGQLGLKAPVSRKELEQDARELDIEGRSKMGKDLLASAVAHAQADQLETVEATDPAVMSDAPPPVPRVKRGR